MSKFKVEDKVIKIRDGFSCSGVHKGDVLTVKCVDDFGGFTAKGKDKWIYQTRDFKLVEWEPEQGEEVEVLNSADDERHRKTFVIRYNNIFYCGNPEYDNVLYGYTGVERITPTHIITVDGKDVEVSEERYLAIKEVLHDE